MQKTYCLIFENIRFFPYKFTIEYTEEYFQKTKSKRKNNRSIIWESYYFILYSWKQSNFSYNKTLNLNLIFNELFSLNMIETSALGYIRHWLCIPFTKSFKKTAGIPATTTLYWNQISPPSRGALMAIRNLGIEIEVYKSLLSFIYEFGIVILKIN